MKRGCTLGRPVENWPSVTAVALTFGPAFPASRPKYQNRTLEPHNVGVGIETSRGDNRLRRSESIVRFLAYRRLPNASPDFWIPGKTSIKIPSRLFRHRYQYRSATKRGLNMTLVFVRARGQLACSHAGRQSILSNINCRFLSTTAISTFS